ncbi:nucleotidyltransferase domain-containing protein [Mycobacterium marinum]|uniref:nucleotidyltransferase domain-containing protein n=1 Tax=Mycobacterium marinum TaxID=1781 RepID=UPI0003589A77|nr:nucleotidyltransferase domain-containing protein [Mycobacterium marinum]EPQ73149.1 hypothetical protein MMMB2_3921 [Mycobacterium marinum MB2]
MRSSPLRGPELIEIYGFDTKFAYHAVRLGIQGVELLTTGRITLPIPEPSRSWLHDLRLGKINKQTVLDYLDALRNELVARTVSADLPDQCDHDRLNRWLVSTYQQWWDAHGVNPQRST